MLDYVLLEKRNQYLKKIIQKTRDLTESIKLLSNIDKQLYTPSDRYYQYGGSFNVITEKFIKAFENSHEIGADNIKTKITELTTALTKLEDTAKKYGDLHTKMEGINPVFIKELDKMGETIETLIARLTKTNTVFNEFELKQAIELFPQIRQTAEKYTAAFENYKTNPKENETNMLNAYRKLFEQVQTLGREPNYNLFYNIIKVLYPPLPWDSAKGDVYNDAE